MTQEDKELLLKDLCARLPYGFLYQVIYDDRTPQMSEKVLIDGEFTLFDGWQVNEIKPYLRPMSCMTEEERNEYFDIKMQECERVALAELYRPEAISIVLDWLNEHHFDYRSLIEKGLALEAPEGMYKTE